MQFAVGQVTVQHLVVGGLTSTLLIMPIRILIHRLILAPLTLFQMELQTVIQSWLEPVTFHLTRLRYFISLESRCLFYPHARRNHQNSKKNYAHKNQSKTYCKAESIGMTQHFAYSIFDSWLKFIIQCIQRHARTRSVASCDTIRSCLRVSQFSVAVILDANQRFTKLIIYFYPSLHRIFRSEHLKVSFFYENQGD